MQLSDSASSSSQRRVSVREAVPSSRTRMPGVFIHSTVVSKKMRPNDLSIHACHLQEKLVCV